MHDVEGPVSDPGYPGVPGSGPPSFRANESAHYHRPLARTVNKNWLCFAGCVSVKVLGRRRWVAAASASLPMVCPSVIGKTFGLAAATRPPGYSHRHRAAGPCPLLHDPPKRSRVVQSAIARPPAHDWLCFARQGPGCSVGWVVPTVLPTDRLALFVRVASSMSLIHNSFSQQQLAFLRLLPVGFVSHGLAGQIGFVLTNRSLCPAWQAPRVGFVSHNQPRAPRPPVETQHLASLRMPLWARCQWLRLPPLVLFRTGTQAVASGLLPLKLALYCTTSVPLHGGLACRDGGETQDVASLQRCPWRAHDK